jgi:hypothetical protein
MLLFWFHIVLVRAVCVFGVRVCLHVFVLSNFRLIVLLSVVFVIVVLFIRRSGTGRSLQ